MNKALGIVVPANNNINVEGMSDYRSIGAFSFMGRYRMVDFPISNMSNSGIDNIQVHVEKSPLSLLEHIGTGRHYNINSKKGKIRVLVANNSMANKIYNTDIAAYYNTLELIKENKSKYVVVAPGYMVFEQDYSDLILEHEKTGADVTLLYHSVDNARENYLNCNVLELNKQKGVLSIEPNNGTSKNKNIFMESYVMSLDLFVSLIEKAHNTSSVFTMTNILNIENSNLDIRGFSHKGFFGAITDLKSYYDTSLSLTDNKNVLSLFKKDWPIYTKTNDSCPTQYFESADIKKAIISNGCKVEGTVINSILGRGCVVKKGAVIKNSILLTDSVISENVVVENFVIDKLAKVVYAKELIADSKEPGYVKRHDTL